jgi:ribonucleoside-diphosphate reductase alpha chain
MYYLRTKAAVDAIKFTLDNSKKQEPIAVAAESEAEAATAAVETAAIKVETTPLKEDEMMNTAPMSAEEMKALVARAREGQADDDCLMCGS